jgi:hypothetical protein
MRYVLAAGLVVASALAACIASTLMSYPTEE